MPVIPSVKLNGEFVEGPRNWEDFSVLATFDKSSVQANISTNQLEFVNSEAQKIIDWFEAGLNPTTTSNGCYQGMPIELSVNDGPDSVNAFTGIIDFTDDFEITNSVNVKTKLKSLTGLNILEEQLEGVSFALLKEKLVFTDSDNVAVPYFEDHDYSALEVAVLWVSFFLMVKELIFLVMKLIDVIAESSGGLTGVLVTIIQAAALVAFGIALVVQIVNLINNLFETIYPIKRYFSGISLRTILENVSSFFGLTFESSVTNLDRYVFLPSQTDQGPTSFDSSVSGLPTARDEGYIVSRMFDIAKNIIYGKFIVSGDTLHLEPLINETFWETVAPQYVMPSKLMEYRKYNINELKARELITFQTDANESFTFKNYAGTTLEVQTRQSVQATVGTALSGVNITKADRVELLKGANDVRIPWALGTRRAELTTVEEVFESLINAANKIYDWVDGVAQRFGGRLTTRIPNTAARRRDTLKVSQSNFGVAKLLNVTYVDGEALLKDDYRSGLSGKYLWDTWHKDKSFVNGLEDDDYRNQWRLFTDEVVDFSFDDFVKLTNYSYFSVNVQQADGSEKEVKAKAEKLEWNFGRNSAKITFRAREVYNTNLNETQFE